jgi:hypothetical protein
VPVNCLTIPVSSRRGLEFIAFRLLPRCAA